MDDLDPRHQLTTRALAILELAGAWIERAEEREPPMVTDDEKLMARARFDVSLRLVRRVARRQPVYAQGVLLPGWVIGADPRVAAIETIRQFARIGEADLDVETRSRAATEDAKLRQCADYMATLPRAAEGRLEVRGVNSRRVKRSDPETHGDSYDRGPVDTIYEMVRDAQPGDRPSLEAALLETTC